MYVFSFWLAIMSDTINKLTNIEKQSSIGFNAYRIIIIIMKLAGTAHGLETIFAYIFKKND